MTPLIGVNPAFFTQVSPAREPELACSAANPLRHYRANQLSETRADSPWLLEVDLDN